MSEWQPIETAPRDDVIDVWHKEYGRMTDVWWAEDSWNVTGTGDEDFSHWMRRPDAPNKPALAKYQYYRGAGGCPAEKNTDSNCECWHDEGTGAFSKEVHDSGTFEWRIKPSVEVNDK